MRKCLLRWIPDGRRIWDTVYVLSTDGQKEFYSAKTMLLRCLQYRTEKGLTLCHLFAQHWGSWRVPLGDIVLALLRLTEPESDVDELAVVIRRLREEARIVADQRAWANEIGYHLVATFDIFGLNRNLVSTMIEEIRGWKDLKREAEARIQAKNARAREEGARFRKLIEEDESPLAACISLTNLDLHVGPPGNVSPLAACIGLTTLGFPPLHVSPYA